MVDGRMDLSDMQWEGVVSIRLLRDRDQWRIHVNTVIYLMMS
jgi:hypothetical protein